MYKLIRPLLFAQDPENMHNRALTFGEWAAHSPLAGLFETCYKFDDPRLHNKVFGLNFRNPVSNAAGFDKNAHLPDFLPLLNFGFVEIGSVTAQPRDGNPKPRMFRLEQDKAMINRMGLNNIGADRMAQKLAGRKFRTPLGINIAKTHDPKILGNKSIEDFCYSFKKLYEFCDYLTLNISCPNTAEGKTFEEVGPLRALLSAIKPIRAGFAQQHPVLLKLSVSNSHQMVDAILQAGEEFGIAGYIIGNSPSDRENMTTPKEQLEKIGKGGLSGQPVRPRTTELVRYAYSVLRRPCIIACGGIDSAKSAYENIRAGASLVQLYAGLIYEGPGLVKKINRGLVELLKRDGFKNIAEAVGADVR